MTAGTVSPCGAPCSTARRCRRHHGCQIAPSRRAAAGVNRSTVCNSSASEASTVEGKRVGKPALSLAYAGRPGTFAEEMCLQRLPEYRPLPCENHHVACEAVTEGLADYALLPIENTIGGSRHPVYDVLLHHQLHIIGEYWIPINLCCLVLPGSRREGIRRIISNTAALSQCSQYLRGFGATLQRQAVDDTAAAAALIADNQWMDSAALSTARAAKLYGLEVLDSGVSDDNDNNLTRFIVLSRQAAPIPAEADSSSYKTSILFTLKDPHAPGQLFRALSVLALRDIDLTKIESRPLRSAPYLSSGELAKRRFSFVFYIDFVGSLADERCQNALRHLQEVTSFLRVLGSFPRDTTL